MANETSQMEVERENLAILIVDQPPKTTEPQFFEGTMFGLPREWTVEMRPRKACSKYFGKVDQIFYEPGTHRQFRSLKAAKRHLGLDMVQTSHKKKSKASKAASQSEIEQFASKAADQSKNVDVKDKFGSSSKVAEEDRSEEIHQYFDKISKRVRWQLINCEENSWEMYVMVPDVVQQRWTCFLSPTTITRIATH